MIRKLAIPVLSVLLLSACGTPADSPSTTSEITVFAAAGLTDVITEMAQKYEEQTGVHVAVNFASSGILAKQIIARAPFDIYLSANPDWMTEVVNSGLAERSAVRAFASNGLVAIVSAESGLQLSSLKDLLSPEIAYVAIADPDHAPAGVYAWEALKAVGIWDEIKSKLVPAVTVRAALSYVERGEAEAGLVYTTDALAFAKQGGIRIAFEVPESLYSPIRFQAVLAPVAEDSNAARFFDFILSEQGRGILAAHGFTPPAE